MNDHSRPGRFDSDLVAYASGMVSVQAHCAVPVARELMADHARFACVTLATVADAVVVGVLEFC